MDYPVLVANQKEFFNTEITRSYSFRLNSLLKLREAIQTYESRLEEALYLDLGKSKEESFLTEIGVVLSEITYAIKHLKKWMKPTSVATPITLFKASSKVYHEPLGVVLILSPWNYPFQLAMNPLVGALAAGNTIIVKPSSSTPHVAQVIYEMLKSVFEENYVFTVLGNASEAEALLYEKVDYIFFTGSIAVGKKVMQIASNNLTPFTLELGGKSPCIIDSNLDLKMVAKRVAFGKLINAGQTCIAPDYVLIKRQDKDAFVTYYKEAVRSFYGENALINNAYPKIINPKHVARLMGLLENETILFGGHSNGIKIEPTILDNITFDSKVMQEEIFGPILPLITYQNIDEVIALLKTKDKPLALYLFTNDKTIQNKVINSLSFGGGTINDTLMHFVNHHMGFGGVGHSGTGSYHGYRSFTTFSHHKSILNRSLKIDLKMRYHPLTSRTIQFAKKVMK